MKPAVYGPTYKQENPFPRTFWPERVKTGGKIWATVMFLIWSGVLATYVYIRFSGQDYNTLFPEEDNDTATKASSTPEMARVD